MFWRFFFFYLHKLYKLINKSNYINGRYKLNYLISCTSTTNINLKMKFKCTRRKFQESWLNIKSELGCILPYCFPVAICCSAGIPWAEYCQRQLTRQNQIEKESWRKFSCEKNSKSEHQDFTNIQEIVAYLFLDFGKFQQQFLPMCSYFFCVCHRICKEYCEISV